MTNPDTLEVGPALDALVAEKVMGCKPIRTSFRPMCGCGDQRHGNDLSKYSTDIAAAWKVVEKLRAQNKLTNLESIPDSHFAFEIEPDPRGIVEPQAWAVGSTAPLAICRAALKAVGA